VACLAGIVFSSVGFDYTPFIMYVLGVLAEIGFTSIIFRIEARRLYPSIVLGSGLFFFLIFSIAYSVYK
jgi:hypothetical protein